MSEVKLVTLLRVRRVIDTVLHIRRIEEFHMAGFRWRNMKKSPIRDAILLNFRTVCDI